MQSIGLSLPILLPVFLFALSLTLSPACSAAPLILNEYNAVSSTRYLDGDTYEASTQSDSFFGRVMGNGGNWFELVVTEDHLDVRGWTLRWQFEEDAANHGFGAFVLTDHPVWENLRAGTLLTFCEQGLDAGGLNTDISFNPAAGDWWINLLSSDARFMNTTGAVTSAGVLQTLAPGAFRVNNDQWTLSIEDATGAIQFGPAGEGANSWAGSGVSGSEVGRLEADPSNLITAASSFDDGSNSTFGAPNTWSNGTLEQDFTPLRNGSIEVIRISGITPLDAEPGVLVRWLSQPGIPYLAQWRVDIGNSPSPTGWQDLAHVLAGDVETTAEDRTTGSSPTRFYRIILPQLPPQDPWGLTVPSGFWPSGTSVGLTNTSSSGIVRYTLDGSEPTLQSPVFTDSQALVQNSVLRTRLFEPGHLPTPVQSSLHLVDENFALPVFGILTAPDNLFDPATGIYENPLETGMDWERPASLIFIDPAGSPSLDIPVGIRMAGAYSRNHPKKSFRSFLRREYGATAFPYPVLSSLPERTEFNRLLLRGGATDQEIYTWSLIRDPLMVTLARGLAVPASTFEFVNLFVNDAYWGIYTAREDLDAEFVEFHYRLRDIDLIKFDDSLFVAKEGDLQAWNAMVDFFDTHSFVSDTALVEAGQYLNVDSFMDYTILNIFGANQDWPQNNMAAFRPRTGETPWQFVFWDGDLTFGLAWWETEPGILTDQARHDTVAWATRAEPRPDLAPPWLNTNDWEAKGSFLWSTLILRRLLENPGFQQRYLNRFADLLNTTLSSTQVLTHLSQLESTVRPDIPREIARWEMTGIQQRTMAQWEDNLEVMRQFATRRPDFLRDTLSSHFQLPGTSSLQLLNPQARGRYHLNSLVITDTAWSGRYFQDVPVAIQAVPDPGYLFAGWTDSSLPATDSLTLLLGDGEQVVEAIFVPAP